MLLRVLICAGVVAVLMAAYVTAPLAGWAALAAASLVIAAKQRQKAKQPAAPLPELGERQAGASSHGR
jgi:hypothetical protein